jgi:hypothetical protein
LWEAAPPAYPASGQTNSAIGHDSPYYIWSSALIFNLENKKNRTPTMVVFS